MATSPCDREDQAVRNRRNFPFAAACLDEARTVFGPDCKLVNASEGGKKIGKFPPKNEVVVTAGEWLEQSKRIMAMVAAQVAGQANGRGRK